MLHSRRGTKALKNDVVIHHQIWELSEDLVLDSLTPHLSTTQHCLDNFWVDRARSHCSGEEI